MKSCLRLIIFAGLVIASMAQNGPTLRQTACALTGKSVTIDCGPGNGILIYESIIGSSVNNNGVCAYQSGDCYENFPTACATDAQKCAYFAPARNLTSCNKKSDYVEVRYYCTPVQATNTYDICATTEITQQSGIIKSPNYPSYKQTNGVCTTKITVPVGKTINIFVIDMNIQKRDSFESCSDYLRITDTTDSYNSCGLEKPIYAEDLCSSVVYISYKANTQPGLLTFYRGFKLYYEVRDLGSTSSCGTATPPAPIETTTAVPVSPTVNPLDLVLNASQYFELQVCKSAQKTIAAPDFNLVYIEQLEYRAQTFQIGCQLPSSLHCTFPHPINCNLQRSCSFNLLTDYTIESCSKKKADYIFGIYRFIPIQSKIRFFTCDTQIVNGDQNPNGILFSQNYPNYAPNVQCLMRLQTSSPNKGFKIYITDISIEDDCSKGSVQINDRKNPTSVFCGSINIQSPYTYQSCSNNVEVTYKTSNQPSSELRGFRAYYELVDLPASCQNVLSTTVTTQAPTTTNPTQNDDVVSQVMTNGGNANGKPCQFPFKYQNNYYNSCIAEGSNYWCSATDDYDRDRIRGDCAAGLTTNQKFTVCDRKLRTFSCPKGYLLNVISALGASTTDGTCNENKIKCSQSLYSQVQSYAGGKDSYRIVNSFVLTECSNARADVVIIDYNCVPETVPYVPAFDQCSSGQLRVEKGVIYSPNYPTAQNNLNCVVNIIANSQKLLNLYAVSTELQAVFGTQECTESYFQLDNGDKICGNRKSGLLTTKCGTNFQLSYFVGTKPYKGFKVYYELTNVVDQNQCIEFTTSIISTTSTPQPSYVQQGIASGSQFVVSCNLLIAQSITCPNDYVISVRRYFYGKSATNKCFFTQGDLISYSGQNVNCNGKRTCVLPSFFVIMPEHNVFASYLQVEYECIPTKLPPKTMCGLSLTDKNGIINTPSYPNYDQSLNCKTTITAPVNMVIKAFIINLSVAKECSQDSVTFSEPTTTDPAQFCGQLAGILAFETCGRQLDINVITRAAPDNSFDGVSIYYETVPKPIDFVCTPPTTTTTTLKPTTTTSAITTTTKPAYLGLASPVNTIIRCKSETITCPQDYVIVIRSSFYGVKSSNTCEYSPTDCFGPNTQASFSCNGRQSCFISFFQTASQVPECDRKDATYFFLDYQCVPVKNAGNPPSTVNAEFCSPESVTHKVAPNSGLVLQSQNYPAYPTASFNCNKTVTTEPGYALDVFFIAGTFPGKPDCNGSTDFVDLTDGFSKHKICGSPNQAKYLMETRSNSLQVSFMSSPQLLGFFYKGFQIYLQTVKLPATTPSPQTSTKPPVTPPIQIGFLSEEYYVDMCVFDTKTLTCPNNYIIVVLQQSIVFSRDGCAFKPGDCREPTDLVSTECAGKQTCNIYFPLTPITFCQGGNANGLEYVYQCVPSAPSSTIKVFSCDDKDIRGVKNGIIQSPKYPEYAFGIGKCEINLTPMENSLVKLYLVDLSLSDNVFDDALAIDNLVLGENEDSMSRFIYSSNSSVLIRYKSLASNNGSFDFLKGFRIYFENVRVDQIKTTTESPSTTKNYNQFTFFTKVIKTELSSNLIYGSLGVGIPCILVLVLVMLYLNKSSGAGSVNLEIKYSNKDGKLNDDIRSFSNPILE